MDARYVNICQARSSYFCYASTGVRKKMSRFRQFSAPSLSLTPLCKKVSQSGMQLQSEACCATQQHQAIQMKTVHDVSCTPQSAIMVHIILIPCSL